jgi:signal transduction histidine kinase
MTTLNSLAINRDRHPLIAEPERYAATLFDLLPMRDEPCATLAEALAAFQTFVSFARDADTLIMDMRPYNAGRRRRALPATAGDDFAMHIDTRDKNRFLALWWTAWTTPKSFNLDCRLVAATGPARWYRIIGIPQRTISGGLNWLTMCVDIDDLKRELPLLRDNGIQSRRAVFDQRIANLQLYDRQTDPAQSSQTHLLGEMASTLSHEITQPLSAALSYASATVRMLQLPSNRRTQVMARNTATAAIDQLLRASAIVRTMREFILTGEINRESTDIKRVIEESVAIALIGIDHVDVSLRTATDICPMALLNRTQIQQVVINIIRNATEAMDSMPDAQLQIFISSANDAMVEIAIQDSGPGVSEEIAQRLFCAGVTTKPHGMGVGLSICRTIIEGHGGQIWAEPQNGHGTTIKFTLPVHDHGHAHRA